MAGRSLRLRRLQCRTDPTATEYYTGCAKQKGQDASQQEERPSHGVRDLVCNREERRQGTFAAIAASISRLATSAVK